MEASRPRPGSVDVLVIDADPEARAEVCSALAQGNVACREAGSGKECLREIERRRPDLVALDLYLPDQSGIGLCRTIREMPDLARIPIIVVSAQASEIDRVVAFESGVDDFLARPFHPAELRARVDAVLRGFRARRHERPATIQHGVLGVDPRAGRATVDGHPVDLTAKEFALLCELVSHAGRVVRRRQLIDELWGTGAVRTERAIDAHIKSIRRKLGRARHCIETVRGVGYRFVEISQEGGRRGDLLA
jgi:DNA-binding response OmpR family regulator